MARPDQSVPSDELLGELMKLTGLSLGPRELRETRSVILAHLRRMEILRGLPVRDDMEPDNTLVREGE